MFYLLTVLLAGISFSIYPLFKMDMWHAQGFWVQLMLLVCFSWTFFEKPRYKIIPNKPLGLINLYIGLHVCWFVYMAGTMQKYDTMHFFPYFNLLCLLFLYRFVQQYLDREQIVQILNILRLVIILTLLYTTLQIFRMTQFIKMLYEGDKFANNSAVGFLGNGTHLSGFLGSCVPLFLWKFEREDKLALVLMVLILVFTGTASNDPSISGYVVGFIIWCYFWKKDFYKIVPTLLLVPMFGYLAYKFFPPVFWNTSGRLNIWAPWWKVFMLNPITGIGLGGINMTYRAMEIRARHLHLEYFHYLVELGIPILILLLNLIKKFFNIRAEDRLELTLKALIIGFLVSCCFNYPSHLWLPSTWAMFFYASFYALKKRSIEDVLSPGNPLRNCSSN